MTKREWGFVFLLASVLQGFIWYAAFVNAKNGSALNYVSFAGTLISIILAVLAIGYTYGESISQKNKGDTIAAQIAALGEVTKGIKVQAESLEEVSRIKIELRDIAARIENGFVETRERMSGVSDSLREFRSMMDERNFSGDQPVTPSSVDKSEAVKSFMAGRMPLMEISVLIIIYITTQQGSARGEYVAEAVKELIKESINKTNSHTKDEEKEFTKLFTGSVLSLLRVLHGFGLITIDNEVMSEVHPLLIKEVERTTVASPMKAGEFYTVLRENILKALGYRK